MCECRLGVRDEISGYMNEERKDDVVCWERSRWSISFQSVGLQEPRYKKGRCVTSVATATAGRTAG